MARFLAGVASALLLTAAGLFWWRSSSAAEIAPIPIARAAAAVQEPLAEPPAATEKTREEKRFSRYDRDKDGAVSRDEYLRSRRTAYAKLDANGDGVLSFEEYATKTTTKYASVDADKSGTLTPEEFAKTRVVRKARPRRNCPPAAPAADDAEG
jgi:uncharacterized protein YxeA